MIMVSWALRLAVSPLTDSEIRPASCSLNESGPSLCPKCYRAWIEDVLGCIFWDTVMSIGILFLWFCSCPTPFKTSLTVFLLHTGECPDLHCLPIFCHLAHLRPVSQHIRDDSHFLFTEERWCCRALRESTCYKLGRFCTKAPSRSMFGGLHCGFEDRRYSFRSYGGQQRIPWKSQPRHLSEDWHYLTDK